ncbi:hypothetical protein HY489_06265 [Candidatus Woesearchaeota archaeon]|nr:hypothetical protein [Candidatus Woesearchaeota archaeon]
MPAPALHIHSCKKLFERYKLNKESRAFALFAIGSVLTDLEEFGVVKGLHWKAEAFLKYLVKTDPKYAPLALGMAMHEEMDKTLDKHYVTPNTSHAEEILKLYNGQSFPEEGHYFLDHVMTCQLVEKQPDIITVTERAKKRLRDKHVHKIAYHLTTFFGGNQQEVLEALQHFKNFDLTQYLNQEKAANMYGQFSILREALNPHKRSIFDKMKLAWKYFKFLVSNKSYLIKEATQHAKQKFKNHTKAYTLARKAMNKRFTKLCTLHNLSLK